MKVTPTIENISGPAQSQKQLDLQVGDEVSKNYQDLIMGEEETGLERSASTNEILTFKEMTMLHMLFGSDKPNELMFYGPNKAHHIQRGHLLDVTG